MRKMARHLCPVCLDPLYKFNSDKILDTPWACKNFRVCSGSKESIIYLFNDGDTLSYSFKFLDWTNDYETLLDLLRAVKTSQR